MLRQPQIEQSKPKSTWPNISKKTNQNFETKSTKPNISNQNYQNQKFKFALSFAQLNPSLSSNFDIVFIF